MCRWRHSDCYGLQVDVLGVCEGDCTADVDGDGYCDNIEHACTDSEALNYQDSAILDDGSCDLPAPPEPDNCPRDLDKDGIIGVGAILALLGHYGMTRPE